MRVILLNGEVVCVAQMSVPTERKVRELLGNSGLTFEIVSADPILTEPHEIEYAVEQAIDNWRP